MTKKLKKNQKEDEASLVVEAGERQQKEAEALAMISDKLGRRDIEITTLTVDLRWRDKRIAELTARNAELEKVVKKEKPRERS